MKFSKSIIRILLFTLCIGGLSSCFIGEKSKSNKINGTWKLINTWDMNAPPSDNEYWQFTSGAFNKLRGFPPVKVDSVTYFITQKVSKGYVTIDYGISADGSLSLEVANGTWEIIKMNKTEMVLEKTDGGKVLREFVKDEDL